MMKIDESYQIVKPQSPTPQEDEAAKIIQNYYKEITGKTLNIIADNVPSAGKEIIIGKSLNRAASLGLNIDYASLGVEGVYIKTLNGSVIITGGSDRGVIYSAFTFLEDYLGCHWLTADVKVVPKAAVPEIPKAIDYKYVPKLTFRETDWISPRNLNWSMANKLNGLVYRNIPASLGGGVGYAGGFAHTMQNVFTPALFAQYPEARAFGIKSNDYTDEHPCLSSEKAYEIMLDYVRKNIASYPGRQIVSVTHPDNTNYCVCSKCKAVYDAEGSPAGLMLRFVNRIAEQIEKDGNTNVFIDTFAYQYTRKPPAITVPRSNVIVRLCSIECCFSHPLNDPDCQDNVDFCKDLMQWKTLCNNLHIWDYTTNYSNYNGPFPNFQVIQPNAKFFIENNVIGIYEEGNYQASESNGEFAELRSYLLAKLLWNPDIDLDRAMKEFCVGYYGEAAPYILRYIYETMENTGTKYWGKVQHMGIFSGIDKKGVLNLNGLEVAEIDLIWQKAKECNLTEEQLKRVRLSEISWRYWKSTNERGEYFFLTRMAANEKLYNDMKELGITRIHEGGEQSLLAEKPYFYDHPGRWSKDRVPDKPVGKYY